MDAKTTEAVELLRRLIATPSPSRDESRTADLLFAFLEERGAAPAPQTSTRRAPPSC